MLQQYFRELEDGLLRAIRGGDGLVNPRKLYSLEVARLVKRLCSGTSPVAWCGITAPFDLLHSMGVTSSFVELVGALLAVTGVAGELIDTADQAGYSSDGCSYHRAVMGAAAHGLMPEPAFLVGATSPCSGGLAAIECLARHYSRPLTVLHIPQDESGGNVAYLAQQIRALAGFVTQHTGLRLDRDRLRAAIENTNRTRAAMCEMYALAQRVPSPATSKDLSNFGVVLPLFLGSEAAVELACAYRDEFARRCAASPTVEKREKFRLMWIQNRIQFRQDLEKLLENQYKAVIVVDELNDVTWDEIDPQDPFEGLARRSISIPFNGTMERRVEHLQNLAREYRIDGAVSPCNWGCRQGTGARGLIQAGLEQIGVPVLNLEVDCVDDRKYTEGQVRTRIEAFVEMLHGRPSPWN